ncbi:double-strand-break repair protein rad21-like protein 1 [Brevipalpus obovatus]|uniref:double-strand-break repair protein rad21-like protein 1 n=1 Tax=Brevipalpus obovatus TaxID=246614 RepID=UPI003D9E901D
MFYELHVLGKKGPLAKLWLAAHVMKKMKKHDIQSVNVEAAVESLLTPRIPISLRTLSHLMVGVTVIHNRQVMYLLADLEHLRKVSKIRFCGNVDAPESKLQARISDINLPNVEEMNQAGVLINHMEIDRSRIVTQLIRPDLGSGLTNEPNLKAIWKSFSDEYSGSQGTGPQMAASLSDIIFEDSVVTDDGFGGNVDKSAEEIFGSVILTGEPVPEPEGPIGLNLDCSVDQPTQELLSPQEFTQPGEQDFQQEENIEQDHLLNGHRSPVTQGAEHLLQVPEAENRSGLEIGRRGSRSARSILGDSPLVLEPVEAGPEVRRKRSRTKRAKRVIIDENINIPREQLRGQLTNTSDLIAPRELRFISKYHARMKQLGDVKLLYSTSSIKLNSQSLKRIFEQRLQTKPVEIEETLSHEPEAEAGHQSDAVHEELVLEPLEEDVAQVPGDAELHTVEEELMPSQSKNAKKSRRRSRKEADGEDEPTLTSKRQRSVGVALSRVSEVPRRASSGEADDFAMDIIDDDDQMSVVSDDLPKSLSTQEIDKFIAEIAKSSGSSVRFSDLVVGNRRQEVAAKFYQILVLHMRGLVELRQRKYYDQIYIHKMPNLISVV